MLVLVSCSGRGRVGYICMYVRMLGNIFIILFFFFPASFPRIWGAAILVLFPICSHPTVWNPKSKDFWELTTVAPKGGSVRACSCFLFWPGAGGAYICMYVCTYVGEHFYLIIIFPGVVFPDSAAAILVVFPICSHPTVWNEP